MKNHKLILFFLFCYFLSFPSCKRDEKMMQVSTGTVTNILTTTADISGDILDLGEGATQYGHCYATTPNPNIDATKTTYSTPAMGGFTSALGGLSPSTKYYIKAYLSRGKDVVYGSETNFTTASDAPAVLTTTAITGITKNSAVSGGNITSEGGTTVTAHGVCWNVASNPTVANSKTNDGTGSGSFASSITGLTASTTYYVRAYAVNGGATAYGNEIIFTTSSDVNVPPAVTTAAVTSVTATSASCGGEVTSEGGASVTARGVCWSTSANPTIINSTTTNGSGLGTFPSNLTGLDPGTKYYVRAYATNSAGTAYGTETNFTTNSVVPTLSTIPITSITTIYASSGGNITNLGGSNITVKGVCWSLITAPTIDLITKTTDGPTSLAGTYTSSIAGLNPNTQYYVRSYATNGAGTGYGNELSFPTLPIVTTTAISNINSTTALCGGSVTPGGGASITARGVCWSTNPSPTIDNNKTTDATGPGSFTSSLTGLTSNTTYFVRAYATNSGGAAYGDQVTFTTLASVATSAILNITATSASSGGSIDFGGGESITARGICWSKSANPTILNSNTTEGTGTGIFTSSLTGLESVTTYYVRAYATNSTGTVYGNQLIFSTLCGSTFTITHTDADVAPVSKTVDYGTVDTNLSGENKCWITQNLGSKNQAVSLNDATEAAAGWYWQFNRKQGYKHDGTVRTPLTTWVTSIDENSVWTAVNDPCTILLGNSWRIPTKTEWSKAVVNGGWSNYNIAYSSVLKLHTAGQLSTFNGSIEDRGVRGTYWCSTQSNNTYGWYLVLSNSTVGLFGSGKAYALSIRCLKD